MTRTTMDTAHATHYNLQDHPSCEDTVILELFVLYPEMHQPRRTYSRNVKKTRAPHWRSRCEARGLERL